jgi:hypothetical protein
VAGTVHPLYAGEAALKRQMREFIGTFWIPFLFAHASF